MPVSRALGTRLYQALMFIPMSTEEKFNENLKDSRDVDDDDDDDDGDDGDVVLFLFRFCF